MQCSVLAYGWCVLFYVRDSFSFQLNKTVQFLTVFLNLHLWKVVEYHFIVNIITNNQSNMKKTVCYGETTSKQIMCVAQNVKNGWSEAEGKPQSTCMFHQTL